MTKLTTPESYPQQVFWSDEDEGFIAVAPDLKGCSAFGETREEALSSLDVAIGAWIEAANAAGNPIPRPSRPADEEFSGKLLVRMPKDLHGRLARAAAVQSTSLNQYVVFLLTWAHTAHEFQQTTTRTFGVWSGALSTVSVDVTPIFHKPVASVWEKRTFNTNTSERLDFNLLVATDQRYETTNG